MKILGGSAKGRTLKSPKEGIRPALAKVKGAIFNILASCEGEKVLDLFAGTGNIGLEALSRGASQVTFVDDSIQAIRLIRENLDRCGLTDRAHLLKTKIPWGLERLKRGQIFNLIFVDPPYDERLVNPTLRFIAREKLLAPGGRIIVEHSPREKITAPEDLQVVDERKYGQTLITFLTYG
ncbi:MAG: 16S rRNA (guanine(966)-N(2))-methyltransferase RsmD [Deltaproteobacteria bacterium]|nr:16S rRNA (guanine(966)-N(2))-methyltransferase RsmD [Deltaproteobacteria bacterium]